MMAVLLAIILGLLAGHAVAGAIFWALLKVPESNVWMLSLSALLSVLLAVVIGWVETAAALTWTGRYRAAERAKRSLANIPATVVALLVFAAAWWLTGWAAFRIGLQRGEIDAAVMARFGWTDTAWIHAAIAWAIWFVRYGVGLSLALSLLVVAATDGFSAILRFRWFVRGLSPLRLLLVAWWLWVLIWLPWQVVYWRPRSLPTTWLEPTFVTVKVLIVYVRANTGWALVLRTVTRAVAPPAPPVSSAAAATGGPA